MLESLDGGETWSPALGDRPYRVMRKRYWNPEKERYQFTDQMPTGVILNEKGKWPSPWKTLTWEYTL